MKRRVLGTALVLVVMGVATVRYYLLAAEEVPAYFVVAAAVLMAATVVGPAFIAVTIGQQLHRLRPDYDRLRLARRDEHELGQAYKAAQDAINALEEARKQWDRMNEWGQAVYLRARKTDENTPTNLVGRVRSWFEKPHSPRADRNVLPFDRDDEENEDEQHQG